MNSAQSAVSNNLKKSVGLIHSSGTTHFFDKRLYHVLLKHAYNRLLEDDMHFIDLASLKTLLQFNSNNTQAIKDGLVRLKSVSIEFDVLNQLKSHLYKKKSDLHLGDWHSLTLLSEASIDNSIVSYEFSSTMRRLLYEPDMYSLIDINLSKSFASGYAYSLYEIGLRTGAIGSTGWISVQDFRRIMDVPDHVYSRYRDFKRKVISVAQEEVNALFEKGISNISVCIHEKRARRQVTHLNIEVQRTQHTMLPQEQGQMSLASLLSEDQKYYRDLLNQKYKLHIKQAGLLVEQYDTQRIAQVLEQVEIARKRPGFNNRKIAGFVYAAMMGRVQGFEEEAAVGGLKRPDQQNQDQSKNCDLQTQCEKYLDSLSKQEQQKLVEQILKSKHCLVESMIELKVSGCQGEGRAHVIKHLSKEPLLTEVMTYKKKNSELDKQFET